MSTTPPEASWTEIKMISSWTVDNVNQSAGNVPENCIILGMNTTIPWDNPQNLISLEAEYRFDRIKSAIIIPILFFIGFSGNCINMAVFFKQGLKERINMCLFSLALVDLIYLSTVFVFYSERIYTQFTDDERYGPVHQYMALNRVITLFGFGYVGLLLIANVSTERCICVLFPLKAKRCFPTKTLAILIVVSGLVLVLLRIAVVSHYKLVCFYEMRTRRLSWKPYANDYYFRNKAMINAISGVFYGFCVTIGCPVIVLIATIITAVKLTQTVRWRSQTSSSLSNKEIGATIMLIALSIEFCVICIPVIFIRVAPLFEPRLGAGGVYANAFNLLTSVMEICTYTNSTINFFVYVLAGTRYRKTLRNLLKQIKCSKLDSSTTVAISSRSVTGHAARVIRKTDQFID